MIEQYRYTKFRPDSLAKIEKMIDIVAEYQQQGLTLTARQLYYQFVSRDFIPNTQAEYKKLTTLLADARYAGMVDWDAIEDRGRQPETPADWANIQDRVRTALLTYRLPRWEGQGKHVELWVEKQALAGVLWPLASRYHVTLMVNKGYSSASAMYESAARIKAADEPENVIFYLGDHDPSGEDMVRDIEQRLAEFGVGDLAVVKLALTMEQVKRYRPPPNPAKLTDSRAKSYIAKYGNKSWEVDALPPDVLSTIIGDALKDEIDMDLMDQVKKREEEDKRKLRKAAEAIGK